MLEPAAVKEVVPPVVTDAFEGFVVIVGVVITEVAVDEVGDSTNATSSDYGDYNRDGEAAAEPRDYTAAGTLRLGGPLAPPRREIHSVRPSPKHFLTPRT